MKKIDSNSIIKRTENHLNTDLDDELIAMNIDTGQIYSMADTAKDIWTELSTPITFKSLIGVRITVQRLFAYLRRRRHCRHV